MIIVGAGLAGLIAGHIFPNASIIERQPQPTERHKALLRFRSEAVSLITGIPFRKVTVRKGIYQHGSFVQPSVRIANEYSRKCTERLLSRSIWDIEPVERFVAPEDFYPRLIDACSRRIMWQTDVKDVTAIDGSADAVVSTIPMHEALSVWGVEGCRAGVNFARAPIFVRRMRLHGCDVHQTVYFPDPALRVYRASITGDLLIIEAMGPLDGEDIAAVLHAFAIEHEEAEGLGDSHQSYGKIAPIDDRIRKEIIHRLSTESNVYSVGRFATWRNILLDDVVKDLRIVKGMIEQNDAYARRIAAI